MKLTKFDRTDYQKSLIESLLSSPDVFSICEPIIEHRYFNPELTNAVRFIKQYYGKYSSLPVPYQIKSETGVELETQATGKEIGEWSKESVEKFCQHKYVITSIQDSLSEIESGDYGTVVEKLVKFNEIALRKDLGLEYFTDYEKRIQSLLDDPPTISTGWKSVDDVLFGGIARQELLLFAGGSGVGKSFTLANLGMNLLERKLNVLVISLELSINRISQRFDQMLTGVNGATWRFKTDEIANAIKSHAPNMGNLHLAQLPAGTTANEMRAFMKNFHLQHGYYPDLFVVDYLDEMMPNQHVSADNIAERDKQCASQLRQIGVDLDMMSATASQLNREAIEAPVINQSHIAGGMGKIRVSDATIALRMDESQKHRGIMEFVFLKTRNSDGVFSQLFMGWDKQYVRIRDKSSSDDTPAMKFVSKKDKEAKKSKLGTSADQTVNDVVEGDVFERMRRKLPDL